MHTDVVLTRIAEPGNNDFAATIGADGIYVPLLVLDIITFPLDNDKVTIVRKSLLLTHAKLVGLAGLYQLAYHAVGYIDTV